MTHVASASASSGNLGPGFDYLGLAFEYRTVATATTSAEWEITSGDPDGLVRQAAELISPQPLQIDLTGDIPIGKGLGSSAACIAATMAVALMASGEEPTPQRIVEAGYKIEGHYDNMAAAVYGGLVICSPQGFVRKLEIHKTISILVALPDETLSTQQARLALPGDVPLGAAARSSARTVFLVEGLRTGDMDLLREVGQDELHEPHRIRMRPIIGEIITAARGAGAGSAAMSGAGPAVLAFTDAAGVNQVSTAMTAAMHGAGEVVEMGIGEGLLIGS